MLSVNLKPLNEQLKGDNKVIAKKQIYLIVNKRHMALKIGLVCEFHTILHDEIPLETEEYLRGSNKSTLLRLASFMIDLNPNTSKFYKWRELLNMWFREENSEFRNKIWERCEKLEKKEKTHISLLSPIASLRFFEAAFSLSETTPYVHDAESEINLFKAYMRFVTIETTKETTSGSYLRQLKGEYRIAATLLNQLYPIHDYTNYELGDIFITQIIKAYCLFEFLELEKNAKLLLSAFYRNMGVEDWKDYFQFIGPLIAAQASKKSEGTLEFSVDVNERFEKSCFFLDALSLNKFDTELNADFKLLRGNPIYKLEKGRYAFISSLFVFEKIYKGLYFKLKAIHDLLAEKEKIDRNFRRFYTSRFSESHLLYKVIGYIYGSRSYKNFSGDELANKGCTGAPDYYIRNGNTVFLFENKDVFINAEIKQSFDFEVLEAELKKKFYFENKNGKIDPKAVIQLKLNIQKVLTLGNEFDTNYAPKNVRIYPILIVHDASFNSPGLNHVINHWFKNELNELTKIGLDTTRVRQITIINIDTLILYADFFSSNMRKLDELIDAYIKFGKFNQNKEYLNREELKEAYGTSLLDFSYFIDHYTKVGFKYAPMKFREGIFEKIFPA